MNHLTTHNHRVSSYLRAYKALLNCSSSSTSVENALQISSFMQNKPNFRKSQMNVKSYNTKDYENKSNWTLGQNKPNSNPIKPNLRKAKMNVNLTLTKDYRKKDDFTVRKNKPNSNPISQRVKMNASVFTTKDYENETAFRLEQNKPKQTQSKPVLSAACPERSRMGRMGQFQT